MEPLLLLHGALGSKEQFDGLKSNLEDYFDLHLLNFEGHGDSGPTDSPFRIEYFVENVLGYMDEHGIAETHIFGYSMGGYVALTMAIDYPNRLKKVATLGTILEWNETVADRECRYLEPEKIKEKVPYFAEQLKDRHPSGWEKVVKQTSEMLQHLGADPVIRQKDWGNIKIPVRLHVGDRDTTAGISKTVEIYHKIDKASLVVLPASDHPIKEVNRKILLSSLLDFYKINSSGGNGVPV